MSIRVKFIILVFNILILILSSCEEQEKVKYFTKEDYRNKLNQIENNDKLFRILNDSTIYKDSMIFSFYFRTNHRKKLENLIDQIEITLPENQIIEFHKISDIWELNGRSPLLKLDTNAINKWERGLLKIGFENDCELDFWQKTEM